MCLDCGCNEVGAIAIDGVKLPEITDLHLHSHGDYSHSHLLTVPIVALGLVSLNRCHTIA